ncbi:hypothetical protein [Frederiksenia canicola]|uniref:Uncharacterized protein n=1 Tax=Frederiksenia canicola TaxID=123824 RepID=A0AAE6X4G4_9PAST|nr:hypothetical protein [Frederiksenia canicola]QIM64403.1 hypothetical protein A4G17_02550 [Frederiksenia canicola]RPE91981.1 hypothetical protein EDC49_1779 [Frederiksenia canicola]
MKNYDILIERLELLYDIKIEIERILLEYRKNIHEIILDIKERKLKDRIYELFDIQNKLSVLVYKYEYNVDSYLYNFIYEFDRQDNESVDYLFDEIVKNKHFLIS